MIAVIISLFLSLGIINSPSEINSQIINQNQEVLIQNNIIITDDEAL